MQHEFNFFFFLMIRRPPRSTLLSLHDALPISQSGRHRSGLLHPLCRGGVPFLKGENDVGVPSHRLSVTTDRKSTRLNSSHVRISYAVFCLKKKKIKAQCFCELTS